MSEPIPATLPEAGALAGTPIAGETHAGTAAAGGEHHEEATLLGFGAEFWVYVSMAIFILLAIFVGKLPSRIAGALDDRIAGVKRQLDEAKAVRAEAEALLADANRRREAATKDAEAIVARAKAEAELRADVARRVTAAAATLIASNTDKQLAAKLTDDAIAGLERRLH